MNVFKAREILELPENFDEMLLKQNYKRLAMKYHPDKNKVISDEKIKEVNMAHDFLLKNKINLDQVFTNIFHTFTKSFNLNNDCAFNLNNACAFKLNNACAFNLKNASFKKSLDIFISAKEYCLGVTKQISTKTRCNCEQNLCISCGGCGFSLPSKFVKQSLDICMECTGDGYIQNCQQCDNGIKYTNVTIEPQTKTEFVYNGTLIKILIEQPYFIKNNQLYYTYSISLKDSLTGFHKIFKDPFGVSHDIITKNVIKPNDGYRIIINENIFLVVVFNVIYPKRININITEQLTKLNF